MAINRTAKQTHSRLRRVPTEVEAIEEEVIDTLLNTDRAHHDELGRTEETIVPDNHPREAPPSPREQPAMPIDVANIDE